MVNLFSWTDYRPQREGIETVLSPIESEIILIMWRRKRATVRTVKILLSNKKNLKRATVNAAMKSLCERGLLSSSITKGKGGLKYIYKIKISRRKFEKCIIDKVLDSLLKSYGRTAQKIIKEKIKRR